MKNTFKKVLVLALAALMLLSLASCGKLSGTYTATVFGTGAKLEFDGKKVTVSATLVGQELASVEGTYKIKGDEITFDFSDKDADEDVNKLLESLNGTLAFEKGDDYIKIGDTKYTKQEEK